MASELELMLLGAYAQFAVPVLAAPVSTSTNGSAGGATETIDSVLGNYLVNLIAGRRYLAVLNGLVGNAGVAGDVYACNIRNSGTSSAPTASSTLVAQSEWTSQQIGTVGRQTIALAGSFLAPSTGPNTLAFFSQRTSGSGSFTPVCGPAGVRELYVMYLGMV